MSATLANWRVHPFSIDGFTHVDDILPVAAIKADKSRTRHFEAGPTLDLARIALPGLPGKTAVDVLAETNTDALMVLHRGRIVHESYGPSNGPDVRHIVFSVSKSITAILTGILIGEGVLDPARPVIDWVPEAAGTAWGDATLRHVLDMTVSVKFVEDYADPLGDFARYRASMGWNPPSALGDGGGMHAFLTTLAKADYPHGLRFHYVSPNSDMLGWIIERASGRRVADLLTEKLWQPMGAAHDAFITVDGFGAPRTAGGICATLSDLARFGEMLRLGGRVDNQPVIPAAFMDDLVSGGDPGAWERGEMVGLFPKARYRSKFYVPDDGRQTIMAIGIHGQWIYVDPRNETVIVKLSSQPIASDEVVDRQIVNLFHAISGAL